MANGALLQGNTSTTQHLIVPQPGNDQLFYIFSPSEYSANTGLRYSIVDLSLQGGLGEVTQQNVVLRASSTERVTAVPHANCRDEWIIAHEQNSDLFTVFLLTATGVNPVPVLSRDAFVHSGVKAIGQLKASPNGRRLALATGTVNSQRPQAEASLELLDFDAATGAVTNPVVLPPPHLLSYGVEFSPDGTKLYVTDPGYPAVYQYDLTAANLAASVVQLPSVAQPGFGNGSKNALQLGPDGRIYVARSGNPFNQSLGVITAPNRLGAACGLVDNGAPLGGRLSELGLPSFRQQDLWNFTVDGLCQGAAVGFGFPATYGPDSVRWNFGDPPTGAQNSSRLFAPRHVYSAPGSYDVSLTLYFPNAFRPVLRRTVAVQPQPVVRLGRDTALCPGASLVLNASASGATYRWQDGSVAPTHATRGPGWYWVDVTNAAGCTARDSLHVAAAPVPRVTLGPDTVLCVGQTITLRPQPDEPGTRYHWSDGSTGPSLRVSGPATYWVEAINAAGCSQRAAKRVVYLTPPAIHLGPDTTVCQNASAPFVLDATLPGGVAYRWQDGSTLPTFTPTKPGLYWVTVSTPVCSATDSVQVRLLDCRDHVFIPNIITPNGDGQNDRLRIIGLEDLPWQLSIYNRWGALVYSALPYRQDWDAAGLSSGMYYYFLRQTQTQRQLKGWIEVVR
ncbi:T9SS type B sorting domain-containing protein [Hymenobacter ruricola]|nr:gliding motility-associated C-terminal domain-containing protein [Hymenobacter ruricola]